MIRILLMSILFSFSVHSKEIQSVLIDPVFDRYYVCAEHQYSQLPELGDDLGADCFIVKGVVKNGRRWLRQYKNEGLSNKDWFGWRQNVLAPIDGVVVKTNIHKIVNKPGFKGKGIASMVVIRGGDNTHIVLAHIREIKVKKGDKVKRGQVIAKVGNNGQSYHPHIHIGAWRGKEPLQIRFNQKKIANK